MAVQVYLLLFAIGVDGLKIWLPNTGINNSLNWNGGYVPDNCDNILFPSESDVATYWNMRDVAISGLSLPKTGEIIFPNDIGLNFRDKEKCLVVRDLRYTRTSVKGWLDPDNWKSDDESNWLPHSERVPCTGEEISFPSENTIAVQLPSILLPIRKINFGDTEFEGSEWHNFLKTELAFQLFKGPEDVRNFQWRTDAGCFDDKKCMCARSPYTIRDGSFRDVNPRIYKEAICLYAMPKCPPVTCYSPVVPEGHCCGICGAILKLEDTTEEGLDLVVIKEKVDAELEMYEPERSLKTYVGRTMDKNIQIVVIAEDSSKTIDSHVLSNAILKSLTEQKISARITSQLSGLTFSKYLFNSVSSIVFGTLFAIITLFASIFYVYIILPHKKLSLGGSKSFVFARFDNTLNDDSCEENLEIGIETNNCNELPQAFDNPIYSANINYNTPNTSELNNVDKKESDKNKTEQGGTQEYHNLVYDNLQNSEKLDILTDEECNEDEDEDEDEDDKFSEIKL